MRTIYLVPKGKKLLFLLLILNGICLKAMPQHYFQQEVNFKIQVRLDDTKHELNAGETVEYINHSPDTLRLLYFHLWPNGYSGNETELARQLLAAKGKQRLFKDPELRGYIDSLDFRIDNRMVQWHLLPGQPDICLITLNKALLPGDTLQITTPFHVKIPKGVTSRLGHIGESYQISQWYPKPAVYDRTGWHQMAYQDQGEFYSEFGKFDVSITLPDNYVVGATGNLQNEKEKEWMNQLAITNGQKNFSGLEDLHFPPSSGQLKTIRFTEEKIHDFAWFADKRFHVLKGNLRLPESGKEVTTWVMFTDQQAAIWKGAIPFVNNAILKFSDWNGDYPYHSFTALQSALSAGDGMEYPGITVIGMVKNGYSLDEVIAHEVAHSWFYSALGSKERCYPFMDEGITSANEFRYMNRSYPDKKLWEVYVNNLKLARFFRVDRMPVKLMRELEWLSQSRDNLEQPLNLQAADYTTLNYSLMIYNKAGTAFNYLRAYLGDSCYDAAMHAYYRKWQFKHPKPDDLQKLFEDQTGKKLDWFFGDLLGTNQRMDYKLVRLDHQKLLVKNKAELRSPVLITGIKGDSILFQKWIDGFEGKKWFDVPTGNFTRIKIDPGHLTPELYRLNNNLRRSGLFPGRDPLQVQPYFSLEDPEKRHLMFFPALNWTRENGLMVGLALHNGFLTPKPFEFFVMPFYAFGSSGLAGFGKVSFNVIPYDKLIRKLKFTVEATRFGAPGNQNYLSVKNAFEIYFRKDHPSLSLTHKVFGNLIVASDLSQINLAQKADMKAYFQLGYVMEQVRMINPFRFQTIAESGPSFLKASAEFSYRLSYEGKKNGLDVRVFAGSMLTSISSAPMYSLSPSSRGGREQYLFQGTYPDRFAPFPSSFWSRQMIISEGGLVSPVNEKLGYSRWLLSLSLVSSLPGKNNRIPIKPFVNMLLNDHGVGQGSPLLCEAGLKAGLWNFFEIWIPLVVTGNIESATGTFRDRIRLVFNLDSFSQTKLNSGTGYQIR